jgi:serine/threonine protein phosphatase PrpC
MQHNTLPADHTDTPDRDEPRRRRRPRPARPAARRDAIAESFGHSRNRTSGPGRRR